MVIPLEIQPMQFLNACKGANVKIESRYTGVSFTNEKGRAPKWRARFSAGKKTIDLGLFPFTHMGEKEAYNAYLKAKALHEEMLANNPGK
jgi:hypothetical protein